MKKKLILGVFVLAVIFGLSSSSFAATLLPADMNDASNVVVSGLEDYRNLYVFGGSVVVNKGIFGDLFSVGSSVNIAGDVEDDLFALGGNVIVANAVDGDARIVGGNVSINAPIGGDLVVAGGTVNTSLRANVEGDLWVAGGTVNITSPVAGNAKIAGGEVFINSTVYGMLEVSASKKLTFGPESSVLGSIVYSGKNDPIIQDGAKVGTIERKVINKKENEKKDNAGGFIFLLIMKLIGLSVATFIFVRFFKVRITELFSSSYSPLVSYKRFSTNFIIGLAAIILIPVVSLIAVLSVFGMYLGAILFFWFVFVVVITGVFTVILLGVLVQKLHKDGKKFFHSNSFELSYKTVLTGVLSFGILSMIPVLGGLVISVVFLTVFGTVLLTIKDKMK